MKVKVTEETAKRWNDLLPTIYRIGLNSSLIKSQGLGRIEVGMIFNLHGQKLFLFDEARSLLQEMAAKGFISKSDKKEIKRINSILEGLEFSAQEVWGFERNEDYHNWWMDLPGCTCPHFDNLERRGVKGYIYSGDCPWHGWFDKKDKI